MLSAAAWHERRQHVDVPTWHRAAQQDVVGRLCWNRCSYVKDPRTGRRVARVNYRAQWEEVEVPELRILDQELWDCARARQQAQQHQMTAAPQGQALNQAHRQAFPLSGPLTCGGCGGGYTILGKDRHGCAIRRGKGTCSNSSTIKRQAVERRLMGGLLERMLTPELIATFVGSFEAELASLEKSKRNTRRIAADMPAKVQRRLEGVLRAIENGAWSDACRRG